MKLTKKTILALGVLAAAGAGYAQTPPTVAAPVGTLGQSYSELHFGVSDLKHTSDNQYGVGVAGNLPYTPWLDLGAGYDYGWMHGTGHFNAINGAATAYKEFNGVKPFLSAALGYQWTTANGGRDDLALWGAAAGVEIPVGAVSLTPRVAFADDFRSARRSSQQTTYEVEGNYWVTKSTAAFAGVGFTDVNRSSNDAWNYTVGLRARF